MSIRTLGLSACLAVALLGASLVRSTPPPAQASANENLVMGNPSNAQPDPAASASNYLIARDQFVLSYNNDKRIPNWVSWHLDKSWIGSTGREGSFHPDTTLPAGFYQVQPADYSGTGFDRGHMCPSGDRTRTPADNDAVFVMSNMVPQAPDNNRKTWETLESYCRTLAMAGDELYILCGPEGVGGTGSKGFRTTLNAAQRIFVPSVTWKVVLILPAGTDDLARVTASTQTIAVIVPNQQGINPDWRQFRHSVREVEQLTGLNFFSNVPQAIQDVIENTVYGGAGEAAPGPDDDDDH